MEPDQSSGPHADVLPRGHLRCAGSSGALRSSENPPHALAPWVRGSKPENNEHSMSGGGLSKLHDKVRLLPFYFLPFCRGPVGLMCTDMAQSLGKQVAKPDFMFFRESTVVFRHCFRSILIFGDVRHQRLQDLELAVWEAMLLPQEAAWIHRMQGELFQLLVRLRQGHHLVRGHWQGL